MLNFKWKKIGLQMNKKNMGPNYTMYFWYLKHSRKYLKEIFRRMNYFRTKVIKTCHRFFGNSWANSKYKNSGF